MDNLEEKETLTEASNCAFLKVAVEEWNNISLRQIQSMYHSIPRRLEAVVTVKGDDPKHDCVWWYIWPSFVEINPFSQRLFIPSFT